MRPRALTAIGLVDTEGPAWVARKTAMADESAHHS
jgi:hypothetical protein